MHAISIPGAKALTTKESPRTPAPYKHSRPGAVMKSLTNLMGSVVTGDALADAAIAYHEALVATKNVDLVELPVLTENDLIRRASVAVGWLTELVSHPEPGVAGDLVDTPTADHLGFLTAEARAAGSLDSLDFDWTQTVDWDGAGDADKP